MESRIIETSPQISVETMKHLVESVPVYHSDEDAFFIRPDEPRPAVSYDWEGEVWVRFDPITQDIVGIEIENFESVFLKKHPELAVAWKEVRPYCMQKKTRSANEDACELFIRILLELFSELFRTRPQQTSFGIA